MLWRIHRSDRDHLWFSSDGSGRFDLAGVSGRGTCYLAEHPLGAFVETFRDLPLVSRRVVRARALTAVTLPVDLVLADCTSSRARAFGITGAIHSGEDYERTGAWARAFAQQGFDGVRYLVSHDPAQRLAGVALFGRAGTAWWPKARTNEIPAPVLFQAEARFGIRVLDAP